MIVLQGMTALMSRHCRRCHIGTMIYTLRQIYRLGGWVVVVGQKTAGAHYLHIHDIIVPEHLFRYLGTSHSQRHLGVLLELTLNALAGNPTCQRYDDEQYPIINFHNQYNRL